MEFVRVYSKADEKYSLGVRDGKVALFLDDPYDLGQVWIKDSRWSPGGSFVLINKLTGEAVKAHGEGKPVKVELIPFSPDDVEPSIIWQKGNRDYGDGFRSINPQGNSDVAFDASSGVVEDGTPLILYEWHEGENQLWKTEHTNNQRLPLVRLVPKSGQDFSLAARQGFVVLAPTEPFDDHQHWVAFSTSSAEEGVFERFALVNMATGEALKNTIEITRLLQLSPFDPYNIRSAFLWNKSDEDKDGFSAIRIADMDTINFDCVNGDRDRGGVKDGAPVVLWEWLDAPNQKWKIFFSD